MFPARPMMPSASVSLGCVFSEVARSRSWLRERMGGWARLPEELTDLTDDALLIVSELVTNAITAGSATVELSLELSADCLLLRVHDQAPGLPAMGAPAPDAIGGRGLSIVDALSTEWGVQQADPGKTTWAALAR